MLDKRRLARFLSLAAVLVGSGLPTTGCCDPTTFEISADISVAYPSGVLEREIAVRALGDRVRLEFSEPVRAMSGGVVLEPCAGSLEGPPFGEEPGDIEPPVGTGGANGGAGLGGGAGADPGPEPLGGAGGLGGQGGMSSAEPPSTDPPTTNPPTMDPPSTNPPPQAWDGYSTCVEIGGYNINRRVQITRREESYGYYVHVKGTALDEVKGCGANKPTDMGIVLEVGQ